MDLYIYGYTYTDAYSFFFFGGGIKMSGRTVERITKKPGSTIPAGYMLTVALMQYDDSDVKRMFARGQLAHLGARVIRRW
jgi:hypothetical protein